MSNSRKLRRRLAASPPSHIVAALSRLRCDDCSSTTTAVRDGTTWRVSMAHDSGCPQLRFRQTHGMTTGVALVSRRAGGHVDPATVSVVAKAMADVPGIVGVRVSQDVNFGATERRRIEREVAE